MKKKSLAAIALSAAFLMLITSGITNASGASGYEYFKDATRNALKMNNFTGGVNYEVLIDGAHIEKYSFTTQIDFASGKLYNARSNTNSDYSRSTEESSDGNYHIFGEDYGERGMIYSTRKLSDPSPIAREYSDDMILLAELAADALLGVTKDFFFQDGDVITLELAADQIPVITNVGLAVLVGMIKQKYAHAIDIDNIDVPRDRFTVALEAQHISRVWLRAVVNDDRIFESLEGGFIVTGEDKSGATHTLEYNAASYLTDVGTTVPQSIDITGKPLISDTSEEDSRYIRQYRDIKRKLAVLNDACIVLGDANPQAVTLIRQEIDLLIAELEKLYVESGRNEQYWKYRW